jgi:hypothetical protein
MGEELLMTTSVRRSVLFVSVIAALCFVPGCKPLEMSDSKKPADEWFQDLVGESLSITASDIQGGGRGAHTGYYAYLRFLPSSPLIPVLLSKGYKEVTFKDVASNFELDPRFHDRFTPEWSPSSIKHPRVFKGDSKVKWTPEGEGEDNFVIDEESGIVYFFGGGY